MSNENFAKGSVESTHKVPTSHYHTKHCHAAVVSLGGLTMGLTHRAVRIFKDPFEKGSVESVFQVSVESSIDTHKVLDKAHSSQSHTTKSSPQHNCLEHVNKQARGSMFRWTLTVWVHSRPLRQLYPTPHGWLLIRDRVYMVVARWRCSLYTFSVYVLRVRPYAGVVEFRLRVDPWWQLGPCLLALLNLQKPFRALRNTPYWRYETAPKNDAVYPCGSVVLTKRDVRSIVPTARDP